MNNNNRIQAQDKEAGWKWETGKHKALIQI